jgi:hypothetical protein
MTTFQSNAAVMSGYYFNPTSMGLVPVERDGGRLPNEKGSWIAVPTVAALLLTPVLGALFAFFLPAMGFIALAEAAGKRIAGAFSTSAATIVAPGYAPGMAHLTGKEAGAEQKTGEVAAAPELEKLANEIEAQRK